MRDNNRVGSQRFELSLDAKQVCGVLAVALAALGGAFLLGASTGHAAGRGAQPVAAPRDALAPLDEPMVARDEPAPELKAHQALTDRRSIEKTMPVTPMLPPVLPPEAASGSGDQGAESLSPPPVVVSKPVAPPPPRPVVVSKPAAPAHVAAASPPPVPIAAPEVPSSATPVAAKEESRPRGRYTIQVGAVPRRADAERLAKSFAGQRPHVVAAEVPGKGRWYRVQIGSFDSQDAARQQLAVLGKSGVQGMVTSVR